MFYIILGIYLIIAVIDYLFCRMVHREGFASARWTQKDRAFALFIGLCPIVNVLFWILMIGFFIGDILGKYKFWDKEAKW